jgi:hypothetical protein
MLLRFELAVTLIWVGSAFLLARRNYRRSALRRLLGQATKHRAACAILIGFLGGGGAAAVAASIAWPEPHIHDEFSYLLGGDTFAQGRLTNPPHPLDLHFETFHVNFRPTYCSIYPPGQASFLALGQILGHPLIGVWISFGLACAAVCWMLQAWLPPRWAVVGGLLAALRVGFLASVGEDPGYWSHSYWGGAVAMLGGALVLGAFGRIVFSGHEFKIRAKDGPQALRQLAKNGFVLAIGLAVLANSRPFEGLVLALIVGGWLLVWFVSHAGNGPGCSRAAAVGLPAFLVLGLVALGMGYYNWRLTGNPLRMAYQQNTEETSMVPLFLWQPPRPEPVYHYTVIRDYHLKWAVPSYERLRSVDGYAKEMFGRLRTLLVFYLGPVLWVPLLTLPLTLRNRTVRVAGSILGLFLSAFLATTWFQPHYAAPATCLFFVLAVQGLRQLRLWRWHGKAVGEALVRSLPVACACLLVFVLVAMGQGDPQAWYRQRERLIDDLRQTDGQHLVIVRYRPEHSPHEEWVFNEADIDGAKVIWARDMGEWNRELIDYYPQRQAWVLEPDERTPTLRSYPGR